jgi:hypothetical protein
VRREVLYVKMFADLAKLQVPNRRYEETNTMLVAIGGDMDVYRKCCIASRILALILSTEDLQELIDDPVQRQLELYNEPTETEFMPSPSGGQIANSALSPPVSPSRLASKPMVEHPSFHQAHAQWASARGRGRGVGRGAAIRGGFEKVSRREVPSEAANFVAGVHNSNTKYQKQRDVVRAKEKLEKSQNAECRESFTPTGGSKTKTANPPPSRPHKEVADMIEEEKKAFRKRMEALEFEE